MIDLLGLSAEDLKQAGAVVLASAERYRQIADERETTDTKRSARATANRQQRIGAKLIAAGHSVDYCQKVSQ